MTSCNWQTKAETLECVQRIGLRNARILPLVHFTAGQYEQRPDDILDSVMSQPWGQGVLIVRSSAQGEDSTTESMAGKFESVLGVIGRAALAESIRQVVSSFHSQNREHRILVQPQLENALMSGVAFTCDPANGSPYFVINYAEESSTTAVTSGHSNDLEVFFCSKAVEDDHPVPQRLRRVIELSRELEDLFDCRAIDLEFAFDAEDRLVLFQVRPMVVAESAISAEDHKSALQRISERVDLNNRKHPYLSGDTTVYGVMPDWNPAEIIGVRPRPLALSLYRELITDAIWAYQRNNYGYKNLRSFPLLVDFFGLPYVDVRVSFNSFVPKSLDERLANKLVNYYVDRLKQNPHLHDKIEFEIAISCYTFDFSTRVKNLEESGFDGSEVSALRDSLRDLTNNIVNSSTGLWKKDLEKIDELKRRQETIRQSNLDDIAMIYWLLEDCKRYGTLPFAGLARAGFIAVQMLESLVRVGILTEAERIRFVGSLETVSSEMSKDMARLSRAAFLEKYGHLRPGTYDILAARYDEAPDYYLDWGTTTADSAGNQEHFSLSLSQLRGVEQLLAAHGLEQDVIGLFNFIETGIVAREYSKFIFTKSLSLVLSLLKEYGAKNGISREDMSFVQIQEFYKLYSGTTESLRAIQNSIEQGKKNYARTRSISLPPLITSGRDVWAYHQPASLPNFVTQKSARGPALEFGKGDSYEGCILFIPSADPGYDWIFSTGLAAFITEYGGINSHMAIRAGELGIPAVVGAGTRLYQQWSRSRVLEVDCMNRKVLIVK